MFRVILLGCVRVRWVRGFPADLPDGLMVATNHNSHLDADVLGSLLSRKVDWLSRVEFFRNPVWAFFLHAVSAIQIDRQGVPRHSRRDSDIKNAGEYRHLPRGRGAERRGKRDLRG